MEKSDIIDTDNNIKTVQKYFEINFAEASILYFHYIKNKLFFDKNRKFIALHIHNDKLYYTYSYYHKGKPFIQNQDFCEPSMKEYVVRKRMPQNNDIAKNSWYSEYVAYVNGLQSIKQEEVIKKLQEENDRLKTIDHNNLIETPIGPLD